MIPPRSIFDKSFCIALYSHTEKQKQWTPTQNFSGICLQCTSPVPEHGIRVLTCWLQVEHFPDGLNLHALIFWLARQMLFVRHHLTCRGSKVERGRNKQTLLQGLQRLAQSSWLLYSNWVLSKEDHIPLLMIPSANIYCTPTQCQLCVKYFANISCSFRNNSSAIPIL